MSKVAAWCPFWEKLQHEALHPTTALAILKICGQVKFQHLSESLHPSVTLSGARAFDATVLQVQRAILHLSRDQVNDLILRAVEDLKPYELVGHCYYEDTLQLADGVHVRNQLRKNVRESIANACEKLVTSSLVRHNMRAAMGPCTGYAFKTPTPTVPITAHQMVQGIKLRCGIPVRDAPPRCSCSHTFEDEGILSNGHLLTCVHNHTYNMTLRHHEIVNAIKAVLASYHVSSTFASYLFSTFNPTWLSASLIPDLYIVCFPFPVIIDVTVVDSVKAMDDEALQKAASEKREKYVKLADQLGLRFFAVVIDTYGAVHPETESFIRQVLSGTVPEAMRPGFRSSMMTAIQHALLKGNSEVVDHAVERLREYHGGWLR